MKKAEFLKRVLLLVPAPTEKSYGGGHRTRMKVVQKLLQKRGVDVLLLTPAELTEEIAASANVVILDRRDDDFPELLLPGEAKAGGNSASGEPGDDDLANSAQTEPGASGEDRAGAKEAETPASGVHRPRLIAIDNRGAGRRRADLVWDTLPHPEMSPEELALSLSRMILPESISALPGKATQSILHRVKLTTQRRASEERDFKASMSRQLEGRSTHHRLKTRYPEALIQCSDPAERISETEFLEKLKETPSVVTYFGQTLFEAIYLGKEIYLYDITEYHRELADFFTRQWETDPSLASALDGRGAMRLVNEVVHL